jgi:hypothetical protein
MANENKFRTAVEMARTCVHRGQVQQAVAHLETIRFEVEELVGTSIWAEFELTYAGALAATQDPAAESVFSDAFKRISELSEPNPCLQGLAHRDFGKYLAEKRSLKRAREQYRLSEKIAESLDQPEEAAHCQMCIRGIDLQERGDRRLGAFQKLKRAAVIDGATDTDLLNAWINYVDEIQDGTKRMIAARKESEPSVDYFRGLLSQVKRRRSEALR